MNRTATIGVAALALCLAGSVHAGSQRSMNLKLDSAATVSGQTLEPGKYTLSWSTPGSETEVTISRDGRVVATTHGTLVQKDKPASEDMVVFHKGSDGSPTLSEVRHRGDKAVLVLSAS